MYVVTPYSAQVTGCSVSSVHTKHCIQNGVYTYMRLGLEQSLLSSSWYYSTWLSPPAQVYEKIYELKDLGHNDHRNGGPFTGVIELGPRAL